MSKNHKKWWYDKYDFDDEFYKKEKEKQDNDFSKSVWWKSSFKNPTKSWMSKLGSFSYSFGSSKDEKYNKVLNQLQNSINIINNNDIIVKWSNGANKNILDNIVYLSPNDLIKNGEVDDNEIDVLTGEVYLSKMIKEQSCADDFLMSKTKNEETLWQALEINIAKYNLEKDWPGFIPNVLKSLDKRNCKKTEIESLLNEEDTSVEAIISGISWNLINSHDKVDIPEKYDSCLEAAIEILADNNVENHRLKACNQIIEKIKSILKIDEKRSKKITSASLGDIFGKKSVENSIDSSLSNQQSGEEVNSSASNKFEGDLLKEELNYDISIAKIYSTTAYDTFTSKLINKINYVKNSLMFMDNKIDNYSYGHLSGDIDENSLFKLKLRDERLMSKREILSKKDNAFCFLLDESGSMCDKMTSAKEVLISLVEGLKDKFNISVYGHTAEGENINGDYIDGTIITEYFSPRNPNYKSIISAEDKEQNFDGMAIKICGKKMLEDYPQSRKILFHISDGEPYTNYAHGPSANKYVHEISSSLRKQGVEVYCIGIENAFTKSQGKEMYGDGNFIILKDVHSSLNVLCRFIQQICNKSVSTYV